MGADAAAKSKKISSTQPSEATDAGDKKPRKQRRDPSGVPSSSSSGDDDTVKGLSSGLGAASDVEKTATWKSAAEASEVDKGERPKSSQVSDPKRKEATTRAPKSAQTQLGEHKKTQLGEHKKKGCSERNDRDEDDAVAGLSAATTITKSGKAAKRRKRIGPDQLAGKDVAAPSISNKRVWSEEDVIRLLKGIIECQGEHGVDACFRIDLIHKHIRETHHMQFSRTQLYEKIRRLKHKLEGTISRREGEDNPPAFIKPHDQSVFELSKRIWTSDPPLVAGVDNDDDHGDGDELNNEDQQVPCPNLGEVVAQLEREGVHYMGVGLLKKGFELLQSSKAKTLEERFKANFLAGTRFLLENSKLKNELLEACVEALDSHAR